MAFFFSCCCLWLAAWKQVHGFSIPPASQRNHAAAAHSRIIRLHQELNNNDGRIPEDDPLLDNLLAPLYVDNDDDDDDDVPCDLTLRYGNYNRATKFVFIVSDSTGVTAKSAVEKTLTQFSDCTTDNLEENNNNNSQCIVSIRSFTFIKGESAISQIIQTAHDKNALVVFTIVDPTLREEMVQQAKDHNVAVIDLLGPTLLALSDYLEQTPTGVPRHLNWRSNQHLLSDLYFRRIQAVEFTLKTDDGQCPYLLKQAHVILVGVSRTGKTPLSVVLSQTMGLKVANVPLVVECAPPQELFAVDAKRVFCLTLAPSALRKIRTSRLERISMNTTQQQQQNNEHQQSNYADRAYLTKDLQHARELARNHDWTEIDVTGRAVEETASYISELLKERQQDFCL